MSNLQAVAGKGWKGGGMEKTYQMSLESHLLCPCREFICRPQGIALVPMLVCCPGLCFMTGLLGMLFLITGENSEPFIVGEFFL